MKSFVSRFVEFPDTIKTGIAAVVVWLIGTGFVYLVSLFPILSFLSEFVAPISLAVAGAIIAYLQNAIPDAWGAVSVEVLKIVLMLLAMIGVGGEIALRAGAAFVF